MNDKDYTIEVSSGVTNNEVKPRGMSVGNERRGVLVRSTTHDIAIFCGDERSQFRNKALALSLLELAVQKNP